ncbi:ABC transporter substrate-binding protein [Limnohabitans sp. B9-3]|uniref:ABC transporter substrate-binding protein n=1 Tax=Limnohabitans sp. B9-3 TaxID=1100707 RepID=UPI000C1F029B|nr:ABC transporter substrate-binding protein [Limnohabitans sp. B9-3]PIT75341.1 myristoyl transferase [Limnohabitans sp. B9-3]
MKFLFSTRIKTAMGIAALTLGSTVMAQTETLRIQDYPGLGNILVRVAAANGYCEKNGLKCELKTIPAAPLGIQTLMAGDIDVAFGPAEVVIQAANKGADLKIIGSGSRGNIFYLMAGAHTETPNSAKGYPAVMADLKGKKIGVTSRGSGAEFQLIDMLKGAGMTGSDVTIVPVGAPNTALPAIANKQIDALMLFSPMDGFCEAMKVCRVIVDPRKGEGPKEITQLNGAAGPMTVRGDFAQKKGPVLDAFAKAMRESESFVQNPANFNALLKIVNDTFKIEGPTGAAAVEASLRNAITSSGFSLDPKALQAAADYLQKTAQIDKTFDTSKLLQLR